MHAAKKATAEAEGAVPAAALRAHVGRPPRDTLLSKVRRLRLFTRRRDAIRARVEFDGTDCWATICDISAAGVAIDCAQTPSIGGAATISLGGGRTLRGTVVWTKGGRSGIGLLERLANSDPLLNPALEHATDREGDTQASIDGDLSPTRGFWASLPAIMNRRAPRDATTRMVERAIREQGVAWLVDK